MDGSYSYGYKYVLHSQFAKNPDKYVRAFLLLQKDIQNAFDYIEPADTNMETYSFSLQEILFRACMEVEANFRAILKENNYQKHTGNMSMHDYKQINSSHRLSSYKIKVPYWHGKKNIRTPFAKWATNSPLPWYSAYNGAKHDRQQNFPDANFGNALDAVCGLLVVLSSQFRDIEFGQPYSILIHTDEEQKDGFEGAIGSYFRVKYPDDWPKRKRYSFHWDSIKNDTDPFQDMTYSLPKMPKKAHP